MIFLNEQILKNPENVCTFIEKEKKHINLHIENQQTIKKILLNHMQEFAHSADNINTKDVDAIVNLLKELKNSLTFCNENIASLKKQLDNLNNMYNLINSIKSEILDIENFNKEYCESKLLVMENNLKIQNCLYSISEISVLKFSDSKESKQYNKEENIENTAIKYTENTLIISEMSGKVILPYTLNELQETLQKNRDKYTSIDDIIQKEYTLPLNIFKNTTIARFKEAFKLIRNKEKQSIKEAFDLGMELIFNYNLHPAIITACRNIDELDIYLDYLENGETDKFDCFKIVFEIPPKLL